jgi:iron complex transport system substrate-binding protein
MKRKGLIILVVVSLLIGSLSGCGGASHTSASGADTFLFTDSCGRQVELPKDITRVAPSGAVATLILATIAPEYMVSVSSSPSSSQYQYLPKELIKLPTTGQLYGTKSNINLEVLLSAKPQLIIDLGDPKDGIAEAMSTLQKQTGIPTIYVRADIKYMASAYRTLGSILKGKNEQGEKLASFIDGTVAMARENAAKIDPKKRVSVMYTSGTSGLNANARGSIQSQVPALVGADNAIVVDEVIDKNGGNTIGMEQLYLSDPDVILFASGSIYAAVANDPTWSKLSAVRKGAVYEIPGLPYNWMSNPPSVNMVLGIWWLGNLLYPDLYQYDMKEKAKEIYRLFWNYNLTDEEAAAMLANSTLKRAGQGGGQ